MDNKGKFQKGIVFSGNKNGATMEVLDIKDENISGCHKEIAVVKDISTGKTFIYGLRALERCDMDVGGLVNKT